MLRKNKKIDNRKRIYVLMGPSGSGKTTLGMKLREIGIPELISHSTRPMRKGEKHGDPYYFITKSEFDLLEKIEQTCYAGNFYCLSKKEVEEKLQQYDKVYAIADKCGVEMLRKAYGEIVRVIFIYADTDTLKKRMLARGDRIEDVEKRIRHLYETNEFKNINIADFAIHNIDLEAAVQELYNYVRRAN